MPYYFPGVLWSEMLLQIQQIRGALGLARPHAPHSHYCVSMKLLMMTCSPLTEWDLGCCHKHSRAVDQGSDRMGLSGGQRHHMVAGQIWIKRGGVACRAGAMVLRRRRPRQRAQARRRRPPRSRSGWASWVKILPCRQTSCLMWTASARRSACASSLSASMSCASRRAHSLSPEQACMLPRASPLHSDLC